ncbi:MAG: N-acyl-D-amino-acid deacylase family protein [Polyangiaceae bacterium]|jgi:N-acyl-D-amino-acid deacylase
MPKPKRILITGARLVDGTGAPAREGDLLLEGDSIAEVGATTLPPDEVIQARGLVVAPGFIDVHSHSDFSLPVDPQAAAKVLQGVTTEVVGNCGLGLQPANENVEAMYARILPLVFGESGADASCSPTLAHYRARLETAGISVNAAPLIPHGNVRAAVMGMAERAPTETEIGAMRELVAHGMDDGAFGLSTGLVYPPGAYAQTEELVRLAEAMVPWGGLYATHMRNEGPKLVQAVAEAISIGERAGVAVQLSHHKAAGRPNWGKVKTTLAMVDAAAARGLDVHSDVYPYTAGSTVLSSMFIPIWAFEGSEDRLRERLRDPATRKRIVREAQDAHLGFVDFPRWLPFVPRRLLVRGLSFLMGRAVIVSSVMRQTRYEGMTIRAVAKERGRPLYEAMLDLLAEEDFAVTAIAHVMSEKDVSTVLAHPRTMVGTDGMPTQTGKPHPRTYGTYPRVFEHYVRDLGLLTLEQAVHRMTGMVARKLGLRDRGVLAVGAAADVVVFDPSGIRDRATYSSPRQSPTGVDHVYVGGVETVRAGEHTGARAGRVLAKPRLSR